MKTLLKKLSPSLNKIHFIGIAGCGMAPLAAYISKQGYEVQGSDPSPEAYSTQIKKLKLPIFTEHKASHLNEVDLVVYSSSISEKNPEMQEARKKNTPCLHRSEFLAYLLEGKKAIAVAGTHGKTTTSSIITHMLRTCSKSPQAIIGGLFNDSDQGYLTGEGSLFVAEADESDGSFLNYKPFINIITNIDEDHLDHFGSIENIESAFGKYLSLTRDEGFAIVGWDNKIIRKIAKKHSGPLLSYGRQIGSDVRLLSYEIKNGQIHFDVMLIKQRVKGSLNAIGSYNLQNMLAALATASFLELDLEKVLESFKTYPGVKRRLSIVYDKQKTKVYDDYAHNPGKISAVLSGLREAYPNACIHALFEPHRYSRLNSLYDGFLESFEGADFIGILPVFSAGEKPQTGQLSTTDFCRDLKARGTGAPQTYSSYQEFLDSVDVNNAKEHVYITLGAGSIYLLAEKLKSHLQSS